jgi:hypothetical protein
MPSFGTVEAHPAGAGRSSPGGIRDKTYETPNRLEVTPRLYLSRARAGIKIAAFRVTQLLPLIVRSIE